MSALAEQPRFTLDEWSRIVSDPTKNKAYQALGPGAAVAEYLAWKKNTAQPNTLVRYEGVLARLCARYPTCGLADLDSGQLLAFIQEHPERSWRFVTVVLRGFFRWAQLWKRMRDNPMDLITTPRQKSGSIYDLFTPREQASLVASCQGYEMAKRDRAAILLFLDTGARKGDVQQLQWRDVDLADRVVIYRHRKGEKEQILDFGDRVQRALMDLFHSPVPRWPQPLQASDFVLFPSRHSGSGLTWVNPVKPMNDSTMHRWWYRCLDRAGIVEEGTSAGRKLHLTRHTHGTELYEATGDIEAVRDRLGHANISSTQTYVHQSRKRKRATLVALETYKAALEDIPEGDE